MIDFSTRGYARKKNGRFKQSSLQRWRNRKKTFNDYVMPAVAVITVWSTVWLVDILPMAEAQSVITIENRQFSKVDAAESSSHGEEDNDTLVSAGVQSEERQGKPIKDVVRLSDDTIEGKIREAWIGTGMEDIAVAIAKSESGLNPNAKGDIPIQFWHEGRLIGHSCGIFQIRVLPGRPDCETLKDVDKNIEFAKKLWERSGWTPWSNFKNKAYLKYL